MEPGMDYASQVEQAVKQFYTEANNEAHTWLMRAQSAPEAWIFVWQLLQPTKSLEVQFFAATTLHAKILKQWNEVPETDYLALRERLIGCLKQEQTPKFILAKVCQALAVFMGKCSAAEDPEKRKDIVEELMEVLPYNSPTSLELLLRVLNALPYEVVAVTSNWTKVFWLLQQVLASCSPHGANSNEGLYLLALECTLSWLKQQLPVETVEDIFLQLVEAAAHFAPDRDGSEHENARGWDIVQECLTIILTQDDLTRRPQMTWSRVRRVVNMAALHSSKYFCEILAAMGSCHNHEILFALVDDSDGERRWTSETLIRLLLECSEQPGRYPTDETRSNIAFGFWYALQDVYYTLDEPFESRALLALKTIYARLVEALLQKSKLPSSAAEAGDPEERELFRCYRQDVADTFLYCHIVLRDELIMLLGQRLSQLLDTPDKWTDVESTLHAFKALADSVNIDESKYMPALMELVLSNIPYDLYPDEVLACACSALGSYAEWIGQHPGGILEKVLALVAKGLTKGRVTVPLASMALKDLTRECSADLGPYAPSFLNIIGQMLPNVAPGDGENFRLVFAVGKLLNTLPTVEEQLAHLNATLSLCIVKMRELLQQPLFRVRDAVTDHLKMVTILFQTLQGSIGKAVLDTVLPIFTQIVQHHEWSQDNSTLEAMYICAKHSLSSLSHPEVDARPLLPLLSTSYKKWPHPEALNFLRQLILFFPKESRNIVGSLFAEMSSITLCGVRACRSVRGDLCDWADLLEAYFFLLAQIYKKSAEMFALVPDQKPEMLQCAIACLTLYHLNQSKAIRAAGCFLTHAITGDPHYDSAPPFEPLIEPMCQELVNTIVQCIAGEVPRHCLETHADVLFALNKNHSKVLGECLRVALQEKVSIAETHKEAFLYRAVRMKCKKQRMIKIVNEFSLLCRQQTVGL